MNVNEQIELTVTDNGMNGEGVARYDGKVVFVPYTLKGEKVKAVVKSVNKKYATASVIKILLPSKDRITPHCPHYFKCGGCDMGHVSSSFRETVLKDELKNNLKKIAGIEYSDINFVRANADGQSRNKLSMPFGFADGKVVLGLYRQNTHIVEPVSCSFSSDAMKKIVETVCGFANEKKLSVYCEATGNGLLRHLVLREISGRLSATVVINSQKAGAWKTELGERMPDNVDLFICFNTKKNNVILGDAVTLVKGNPVLSVDVLGVKAELSPLAFFQVNDYIRDRLYEAAIAHIDGAAMIDLYSGIGITSNLAAKKCKRVVAVECVAQAVENANRTAMLNCNEQKIKNVCGNVENVLDKISDEYAGADVLADPPRKGCGHSVMRAIAKIEPQTLVYISCNHATMCRDLKIFTDILPNYELKECTVFDMFPDTHHTEVLAVLKRLRYGENK